MRNQRRWVKSVAVILVVAMVITSVALIIVVPMSVYGADTSSSEYNDLDHSMSMIRDLIEKIETDYKDEVSYDQLVEGAITGIFDTLDPYSQFYFTEEAEAAFVDQLNDQYEGIGVSVTMADEKVLISAVVTGSPAESSGLLAGDQVIKIDGQAVAGKTLSQVVSLMRGTAGTKVSITVLRDGSELTVNVARAELSENTVFYGMIEDSDIGYIKIESFSLYVASQFKSAKYELEKQGAKSLVIDIRNNGGGYIEAAYLIACQLLPDQAPVFHLIQKGTVIETMYGYADQDTSTPVVLLVNEYSASASEILAGALKDNKRASLVGTKTFGKGVAQQIYTIDGSEASYKLSTCYFVTPNETVINNVGITPNYVVENYTYNDVAELEKEIAGLAPMCETTKYYSGQAGLNVYAAQQRLAFLDYLTSATSSNATASLITAKMDAQTVAAIRNFQAAEGLYPYGGLDYTTMKSLDKAVSESLSAASVNSTGDDLQLRKGIELLSN